MKRKHVLLLILALILAVLWWCFRGPTESLQREDPSMIVNRLWVDSAPVKDTDYIHALVMITRLPIGLVQRASSYRFVAERFDYRRRDKRVELTFPQSGKQSRFTYRIWACDDLPPYDLCLELSSNPWETGPRRYYGMREQSRATKQHLELRRRLLAGIE